MAKNQEVVNILLQLSDGNTIALAGKKAKKAGKDFESMGRGAQNADRATKGVTQQSSNSTKEFSKMATMQGGLVAVYATLAAQVFAVSAAFQFLKSSMEMRNLQDSQMAFGGVTGTAYRTLTADIQAATGGMLQFKEAAQAAAIGTAAGLSASQMQALGTAAKNTSLALGRDLTDSFNRLVRGVTKAEPELLDELGIVLRLDPAMRAYATSVGKSVDDLTQFEKSQAVANDVLEQAEKKFGAITKVMDPSAFALQRFAVAFDELLQKFQVGFANVMIPVMEFASKNVLALVGALTLFLAPILKSILPDFEAMGASAAENYGIASKAADEAAASAQRAKAALSGAQGKSGGVDALRDTDYMKKHGIKGGKGMPEGQLSKRQLEIRKRNLEKGVGFSKNMNKQELAAYKRFLTDQEIALAGSLGKRQGFIKRQQMRVQAIYAQTTAWYKKQQMRMVAITQTAAKLMNGAMRLMGWAGIILMIVEATMALYDWLVGVDEAAEKEKELAGEIQNRYGTLTTEIERMNTVQGMGIQSFRGHIEQIGAAFSSQDISKTVADYRDALALGEGKQKDTALQNIANSLTQLSELSGNPQELSALLKIINSKSAVGLDAAAQSAMEFGNRMIKAGAASKNFEQTNKALAKSLRDLAGSFTTLPFAGQITNMKKVITERADMLAAGGTGLLADQTNQTEAQARFDAAAEKHMRRTQLNADFAKAEADYKAGRASGKIGGGSHAKNKFMASRGFDNATKREMNILNRDAEGIKTEFEEAAENLANMNATLEANTESQTKLTKEQEKQKKLLEELEGLQERKKDLVMEELGNKLKAAKQGIGDSVENLQAKNNLKVEEQKTKAKNAQLELEIAQAAQKALGEKATEEEVEAAEFTVKQKQKQVEIENAITLQKERQTEYANFQIAAARELLKFTDKQKLAEKKRAVLQAQADREAGISTTRAGQQAGARQKIANMQAKRLDMEAKINHLTEARAKFVKEFPEKVEEARKKQEEINLLTEEELILRQQIKAEVDKINGSLLAANRELALNDTKAQLTNLRGGNKFGLGLGGIRPQDKLLNQALAQEGLTAAEAEKQTVTLIREGVELKVNKLEHMKAIAEEQASFNTELELANSTADILSNGFVSMFQAMIDGTQSFGDAMKGVMKQVLADLAAAYVKAAALKALQAVGLPIPGARYGGIMSPSGKSFGYGGIATGPKSGYAAMLHGTEAVVPLGNDRSIPVQMTGGGGGMNTVNVSVNVSSNGQTAMSSNGGGALEGMGRQIGALVQQHLQQEMRPGGILNSQGNRSR